MVPLLASVMLEIAGGTKINGGLAITGLVAGAGVTTKYLALDVGNNIVLTSSTAPGTETRTRRVVTGNTTLAVDDYYLGISASADVTITLPGATALSNGQTFTIKDEGGSADSYTFKVKVSGTDKIDGNGEVILASVYGAMLIFIQMVLINILFSNYPSSFALIGHLLKNTNIFCSFLEFKYYLSIEDLGVSGVLAFLRPIHNIFRRI